MTKPNLNNLTFPLVLSLLLSFITMSCALKNQASSQEDIITQAAANNNREKETWPFEAGRDNYDKNALLDLRYLNEKIAGESGFIRLSSDEKDFVKGDGKSIRFWAVNSDVWRKGYDALQDNAKFLAKRGVNMVRWHGQSVGKNKNLPLQEIDKNARQQLWEYVAAMKKEGIYLTISPYYPNALKPQKNWTIPRDSKTFHALLFFDPELQKAYKNWLKNLLEPVNPYTGIALKDDPAIAIIQLQNEDSLLFWTFDQLKGRDLEILKHQFSDWLIKKYGSLEKASEAWGGVSIKEDNFDKKLVGFYKLWELTKEQKFWSRKTKRMDDQTEFLTEKMYDFNTEIKRFLREEIGAKQLINAGNWKTADPVKLNDLERYSYTATEVIGVNRYYNGGEHQGKFSGWAIVNGDKFTNRSVLFDPYSFPLNLKQVANHPMIISESSWVPPLGYQSEGPFLVSIFQSLTGVDGFYWFSMKEPQWRQPSSANGYKPSLGKWVINTPELLGNFPAAALMYRQGYIKQGKPVIQEKRELKDLWQRKAPLISETKSFDPNRDQETANSNNNLSNRINPLAFLVGPVEVTYQDKSSQSQALNLNEYIDEKAKIIRSITGEITWNYQQGFCTINTPKAQGVTGFLKNLGTVKLGDTTITSNNEYGTILVVSMDNKPLNQSQQILVQMGTIARPTGWQQKEVTWQDKKGNLQQEFEVINYGKAPWRLIKNDVTLTINNPKLTQGTILDANGVAQGKVKLKSDNKQISLQFPPNAKYLILD
ncbi:hypothetical protein VB715_21180 [Crocosphaera sp. UHCC 0190]|uniref:hypothetical protein n=1 Tax=Crocosphaera sp. UHCC 0190 TaxID=3110246 RepID=UPI002B215E73|nr:hypothetical protein [Crocosphaera sp. UHCC 0190]MEA5512289.1 hypothetical protein [Crocosphaera sp. UHCC 0190]